jgi:hypothetical protein
MTNKIHQIISFDFDWSWKNQQETLCPSFEGLSALKKSNIYFKG